jgi:hypothetical protein
MAGQPVAWGPEYSDVLEGTIDAIVTQIVALRSPSLISFLERAQADLLRARPSNQGL